jgi:hypothetical protein
MREVARYLFNFEVCAMHFNEKGFKVITLHANFQTFQQNILDIGRFVLNM